MVILATIGCEKEELIKDRDYPRLSIGATIIQNESGATFEGIILSEAGEIQDKGFVWDEGSVASINKGSSILLGPGYEDGRFSGTAVFDLEAGKEYQVKAFVLSEDRTIYSTPVTFTSKFDGLPHSLVSFSPHSGQLKDTVLIRGINLSYQRERISVFFNNASANILSCTDTTITVTVPVSLNDNESNIRVVIQENQKSFSEAFTLSNPVIDNIHPALVTNPGEQITISGSGFSTLKENNLVKLGTLSAQVSSATATSLKVIIPAPLVPDPDVSIDTTVSVKVTFGGKTAISPDSLRLEYKALWTRMNDLPGNPRKSALSFGDGNLGFYGLGSSFDGGQLFADLWEYDAVNDTWTERSSFPGAPRNYYITFTLDNNLYLVGGSTGDPSIMENHSLETWRYNMDTDQWTRLNDFVGTARIRAAGFATDGKGIMVSGCHENDTMNLEVWEYLPGLDSWTRKNDLPNVEPMTYEQFLLRAYGNGESGLILCKSRAKYLQPDSRVYNPVSDSWTGTGFPGTYEGSPAGCYIGDLLYVGPAYYQGLSEYERIYTYNEEGNSWSYLYDSKSPSRRDAGSFSIDERYYFFGGLAGSGEVLLKDVWMLDFSR